jgi:hypothetical protein
LTYRTSLYRRIHLLAATVVGIVVPIALASGRIAILQIHTALGGTREAIV